MEEDNIFYGGIRFPKIKINIPEIKLKGFRGYRKKPVLELKKQKQTGRVSAEKASISKVSAQKAKTAEFEAAKAQSVRAQKAEAARTKVDELESKFENPMFQQKIAKTVEAKQGAFGKKLSPEELRVKVEAEMEKIKQNAELKAQKAATDAKQKISNNNNAVTASSKATLSGKINKLKADFASRIRSIRGADPGGKPRVDDPVRMKDDGVDANTKSGDAADANTKAKGDSEKFRDGSTKADASAKKIEGPNTKGPDGPGKGPDGPGKGPDGPGKGPDGPGKGPDGPGKGPDGPGKTEPERLRETDAKGKSDDAKTKASDNLDRARGLLNKIKKGLKKMLSVLGQVIMIVLPIVLSMLPLLLATPRNPTSLPPPVFNIRPPPPPIITPEGVDDIYAIYVPPGANGPGSTPPPQGQQPPEGAQPPEGVEEGYDESFGNIVFQLTEQPSETISFQISSLSDSLEFDENIVTFPLENWSAPVYLNFISTLETSPEEIVDDIRDNVSEKLKKLKQEKRVDKRPNITIGSLDDYSAKNDEIEARKKRLEYMLKPAETIQQALAKINKRVRMRQSLVEPTYDGGYSEYRGIVEPTYDTKISEELVEPTYDDSEYKILEDKVYPSEKIIEEETYKPLDEIVEPTYDDSEYKEYIEPTLDGGQEEEEEEEEESFEEDILPELDYDTIVSRIDETELSDNYKAEIEFILLEEVSSEVNIVISVLDPIWTLKPNMISFDNENSSASSFFFSEEIYKKLQNVYAEQYANQVEDKFDEYIEDEYEAGMNSISEQEEKNRIKEDEVYDDVYDKVYQRELSKIEDSEYILEQLGGYSKPTISNLFKRTRKLPRVVEK
jgi:hypothetical protein